MGGPSPLLLNLNGFDVRESDGRFALNGDVGNDLGLLQTMVLNLKLACTSARSMVTEYWLRSRCIGR